MDSTRQQEGGDLRAVLAMLRRRLALIVLAVVIGVVGALVFSAQQPKMYESTAGLLFRPLLLDVQVTGLPLQLPSGDPQRDAATNLSLVGLEEVRTRAAARLGPGFTPKWIKDHVDISQGGKSNIVWVKASARTPERAARVANAVAVSFVEFRRAGLRDEVRTATRRVRAQLTHLTGLTRPQRRLLRANLARLQLLGSVQTGDVQLIQRAEPPSSPSSPKPVRNGVIGGALGLLIGLALALGAEQLDRRVRRPEQLEDALGLPVLAAVPRSKHLRRGKGLTFDGSNGSAEPFRRLRANLRYQGSDREIGSVLVTSARAESGKTTVALHLALAAAAGTAGRVLLLEADLRQPRLAELFGLPADKGLRRMLESSASLNGQPAEDVFEVPLAEGVAEGDAAEEGVGRTLDVLPAGLPSPDASELLDSDAMRELLETAYQRYDFVVIDGPPPALVSDAIPLMKQADAVIIVGRIGRESDPQLRRLRSELERLDVTPLGVVANFARRTPNPYVAKGT